MRKNHHFHFLNSSIVLSSYTYNTLQLLEKQLHVFCTCFNICLIEIISIKLYHLSFDACCLLHVTRYRSLVCCYSLKKLLVTRCKRSKQLITCPKVSRYWLFAAKFSGYLS